MKTQVANAIALTLYHGAKHWAGPPAILPAKSMKDIEHGPGFYLTSGIDTARKYAKGGGKVLEFEVDPNLQLIQEVELDVSDMLDFVRSLPRLKHRAEIEADILKRQARTGSSRIYAGVLGNLMHYYKVAHGANGVALVNFYRRHGIDADLVTSRGLAGDEDWYVLYNLDKIKKYGPAR